MNLPDPKRAASLWNPTTFVRFEEAYDTSMGTARIVTDAGPAYIKAMGNRQGPHALASELVGTQLARWFGLRTFEFSILTLDETVDEIPFLRGGKAASGPAFVTRAANGHTWDGTEKGLEGLVNPEDITRLVVFDTWIRNADRHPPDLSPRRPNYDNVFLERVGDSNPGGFRLLAMDHTHCFTPTGELTVKLTNIDLVQDWRLYGLFPAFAPRVRQETVEAAVDRLGQFEEDGASRIIETVPPEWQVDGSVRWAWQEMICRRAAFVAEKIMPAIARACWPDRLFDK